VILTENAQQDRKGTEVQGDENGQRHSLQELQFGADQLVPPNGQVIMRRTVF
jgi:hypothetical protein